MTARSVIPYRGNPRPVIARGRFDSATVIILPVIRIERYVERDDDEPVRKLDRRKRRREQR